MAWTLASSVLNEAPEEFCTDALGAIFEHSPWVARAAWPKRPFPSLAALHATIMAAVMGASPDRVQALLQAGGPCR